MATVRRQQTLWGTFPSTTAATGAAGRSSVVRMGSATNAVLFIKVDGATDITVEVSPGGQGPGINDFNAGTAVWFSLWGQDLSAAQKITFAGAGAAAISLPQVAAEYISLVSSNNVNATAFVNYIAAG